MELDNTKHYNQDLTDPSFELSHSDYYYMYDPFPSEVLDVVISKIKAATRGKKAKIILSNGWSKDILTQFENQPWLKKIAQLSHSGNEHFYIFETI